MDTIYVVPSLLAMNLQKLAFFQLLICEKSPGDPDNLNR